MTQVRDVFYELSWKEPINVKRYSIRLALKSMKLMIGALLVALLFYQILDWIFNFDENIKWAVAIISSLGLTYYSLIKQLFVSDEVKFAENTLGLKRNGIWTFNRYEEIREVMFFEQLMKGRSYTMLTFIDIDGMRQQVVFVNPDQLNAVKKLMISKTLIA